MWENGKTTDRQHPDFREMSSEKKKLLMYGARNLSPIKILVNGLRRYGNENYIIDSLNLFFPGNKKITTEDFIFLDHYYEIYPDKSLINWNNFFPVLIDLFSEYYKYLISLIFKLKFKRFIKFFWKNYLIGIMNHAHIQFLKEYDIVNLHFVRDETAINIIDLPKNIHVVLSFWGTDLFRLKDKGDLSILKKAVKRADAITMHSREMRDFFLQIFGNNYEDKIVLSLFGNSDNITVKLVKNLSYFRSVGSKFLRRNNIVAEDKIIIKLAYSGHKAQRHLEIIEELKNLQNDIKNDLLFILPMTYGSEKDYIDQIQSVMRSYNFNYFIITDYMTDDESIGISAISDIMLNLRFTDAFNNSMIESLLANNILITGSWLPYRRLGEKEVFYYSIDNIKELPALLKKIYAKINSIKNKCVGNPDKVLKIVAPEYNIPNWERAFSIKK